MFTSNFILNCNSCGSESRFVLDDRWVLNDDRLSARQLIFNNIEPGYCPACASADVTLTDEQIDPWLQAAKAADFKVSPQTLQFVESLYDDWLGSSNTFVDYLKDFKQQVQDAKVA